MESKIKKGPAKLHVRSGDTVKVIAGNAKGETGRIKTIIVDKLRATVEGNLFPV